MSPGLESPPSSIKEYPSDVIHQLTSSPRSPQVLRYSALAFGVFYGFYHQRSLTAQLKMNEINREYQHKESLIQQAKAEYTKKTMPPQSKTASGGGTSHALFAFPLACRFCPLKYNGPLANGGLVL